MALNWVGRPHSPNQSGLSPTRGAEEGTVGRARAGPGAGQVFDSPFPGMGMGPGRFPDGMGMMMMMGMGTGEDSPVLHARRHMKRPPGFMSLTAEES